jgi:hypothetical protein
MRGKATLTSFSDDQCNERVTITVIDKACKKLSMTLEFSLEALSRLMLGHKDVGCNISGSIQKLGRELMTNKYPADCIRCGRHVPAMTGHIGNTRGGVSVRHHECVKLDKADNAKGIFGKDLPTAPGAYRMHFV